jgi:hypothetical protein
VVYVREEGGTQRYNVGPDGLAQFRQAFCAEYSQIVRAQLTSAQNRLYRYLSIPSHRSEHIMGRNLAGYRATGDAKTLLDSIPRDSLSGAGGLRPIPARLSSRSHPVSAGCCVCPLSPNLITRETWKPLLSVFGVVLKPKLNEQGPGRYQPGGYYPPFASYRPPRSLRCRYKEFCLDPERLQLFQDSGTARRRVSVSGAF